MIKAKYSIANAQSMCEPLATWNAKIQSLHYRALCTHVWLVVHMFGLQTWPYFLHIYVSIDIRACMSYLVEAV